MTNKFTFVEKSLGLMAGGVFAWFAITSVMVLIFGVFMKSFVVLALYLYGIIAIPIAMLTCLISGHIIWGVADIIKIQNKNGLFFLGFINGIILFFLFAIGTDGYSPMPKEILIYAPVIGIIGGLTSLVSINQAEAFQI